MKHNYFMKLAFLEAEKAMKFNEVPIGCVVVQNDLVIASGYNLTNRNKNSLLHAEIVAIEKIKDHLIVYNKKSKLKKETIAKDSVLSGPFENRIIGYGKKLQNDLNCLDNIFSSKLNTSNEMNEKNFIHYPIYLYVNVEPCGMCLGVLKELNISFFYGCHNYIFGGISVLGLEYTGTYLDYSEMSINLLKEFYKRENIFCPENLRMSKKKR